MGPLSTFYGQEVKSWLLNHPGKVVTQFQIAKLFGLAYARAATLKNAISGFHKTGIYPFNSNAFDEDDFAPSFSTDRTACADVEVQVQQEPEASDEPQPGPSGLQQSSSFAVSPTDIAPVPTYQRPISKRARGKSAIITDSPYRKELVEKEDSKKPEGRKASRKLFNTDVKR